MYYEFQLECLFSELLHNMLLILSQISLETFIEDHYGNYIKKT